MSSIRYLTEILLLSLPTISSWIHLGGIKLGIIIQFWCVGNPLPYCTTTVLFSQKYLMAQGEDWMVLINDFVSVKCCCSPTNISKHLQALEGIPPYLLWFLLSVNLLRLTILRMPWGLSGRVSAFSSECDPGVLGSSPTLGSPHGACFFLCLCLCLSVLLCLSWINK